MNEQASTAPSAAETRAARSFLRQELHAGSNEIPPRRYAAAAKELGIGYRALARLLAEHHTSKPRS